MSNDKVGLTIKKADTKKPTLEDMYLIDQPVRIHQQVEEFKEFLRDCGEDPSQYTNAQIRRMIRNGV